MSGKTWNEYYNFSNFDLSNVFKYSSFLIFILLTALTVFMLFMRKNRIRYKTNDYFVIGFLVLFPLLIEKFVLVDAFWLKEVTKNNRCKIISGSVNNLKTNISKSGGDSFDLNSYNIKIGGIANYGFNQTKALGSPIQDGLLVRICYVEFYGNLTILKLEIQE